MKLESSGIGALVTVIAAVADGTRVWMAADSQATDGHGRIWARAASQTKLVRLAVGADTGLMACEGAGELESIARHRMKLDHAPDPTDDADCNAWAGAVAESFAELAVERVPPVTTADGAIDGRALLGHAGRLWLLAGSAALRIASTFTAIGAGGDYALGALHALDAAGRLHDPVQALRIAVETAIVYDDSCGGPVVVDQT